MIDPKIIIGGIVVLVIIFFLSSGSLKFSTSIKPDSSKPQQPEQKTQESTPTTQSKLKTYQNESSGISVEYPENWSIKENPAAGIVVAFGSPKESSSDTFVDNINISTSDISSQPNLTLAKLADSWLKQTESAPSFNLLDRKTTSMAGEEAEQLIYSFAKDGIDVKGMVVITMKNKKAYIVTYTAEAVSYDKFVDVANTISTSLQIK